MKGRAAEVCAHWFTPRKGAVLGLGRAEPAASCRSPTWAQGPTSRELEGNGAAKAQTGAHVRCPPLQAMAYPAVPQLCPPPFEGVFSLEGSCVLNGGHPAVGLHVILRRLTSACLLTCRVLLCKASLSGSVLFRRDTWLTHWLESVSPVRFSVNVAVWRIGKSQVMRREA